MSETWLKPFIPDSRVQLPDYQLFRNDRANKQGGGVCVYVHKSISAQILRCSDGSSVGTSKVEYIILRMMVRSAVVGFVVTYRPPKVAGIPELFDAVQEASHLFSKVVIVGDFNSDMLVDSYDSKVIKDLLLAQDLSLVNNAATHHTSTSHTLLDLIITDSLDDVLRFNQSAQPQLSGHDSVQLTMRIEIQHSASDRLCFRNLKCLDTPEYVNQIESIVSSKVSGNLQDFTSLPLNDMVDCFTSSINSALNSIAPIIEVNSGKRRPPWLSQEILNEIQHRNRLRNLHRRYRSKESYDQYKTQRNHVKTLVENSKIQYNTERLSQIHDSSHLWKELRSLGIIDNKLKRNPLPVSVEVLNDHFVDSVERIALTFTGNDMPADIFDSPPENRAIFNFQYVTNELVSGLVAENKTNSQGIDEISHIFLKKGSYIVTPMLREIINKSFATSTFPEKWLQSVIIPIEKIKHPTEISQYRPISILCSPSKILESVVSDQLMSYLGENNLLDPYQSGYRKHHSVETLLNNLLDDIRLAADQGKITFLVLFDFSKAFDFVNHDLLLRVLENLGCSNSVLEWFSSYLANRKQAVKDEKGNLSHWRVNSNGVPQGAVLGPLLFSLLINKFSTCLQYCRYNVLADDIQIHLSGSSLELATIVKRVSADISSMFDWAKSYMLKINLVKTKVMILGTSRTLSQLTDVLPKSLNVRDHVIPVVTSARNLGLMICSTLSWRDQSIITAGKIWGVIHQLKRSKASLSFNLRKQLIISLVFPHLDFCSTVQTNITLADENIVQKAFNAAIRFIFHVSKMEHISPYYQKLNWLRVRNRRKYAQGLLVFKLLQNRSPAYLANQLVHKTSGSSRNIDRNPHCLNVPPCRTEFYKQSFIVSSINLWNSLPSQLVDTDSIGLFKTRLHSYLMNMQTVEDS